MMPRGFAVGVINSVKKQSKGNLYGGKKGTGKRLVGLFYKVVVWANKTLCAE